MIMRSRYISLIGILICAWLQACAESVEAMTINLERPISESLSKETLILYWNMDEGSGVELENHAITGTDYHGFLFSGGFTRPEFGPSRNQALGNAVWLRGGEKADPFHDANPYIEWLGDSRLTALDLEDMPFTAGLWIQFTELGSESERVRLINRGRTGVQDYWDFSLSRIQTRGAWLWVLDFSIGNERGNSERARVELPVNLQTERWYHLAFTVDQEKNQGSTVSFYFNGELLGTRQLALTVSQPTNSDRRFTVGERGVSSYQSVFNGWVDEVFVAQGVHQFTRIRP